MKYCCEAFADEAGHGEDTLTQFMPDDDGETWNILGCCGGGCYVVTEMKFCPFCGSPLKGEGQHATRPEMA